MPDSPKVKNRENNSEDDSEVELVEETQKPKSSSSWPQALQDLRNNNNKPFQIDGGQPLIYPRPSSDLLRPGLIHPLLQPRFAAAAVAGVQPQLPFNNFTGWLYRGMHPPPPLPQGYPLGRGHELMRRLCTMNPAFAQSIIEDYIRPTVRF